MQHQNLVSACERKEKGREGYLRASVTTGSSAIHTGYGKGETRVDKDAE